ncbi:MAG: glycosyltransferase family 39 protein [Planctomycetes bacterium]|nr:glycosyltransferase family 39 protein [Planctomycetota bacterium]
MFPPGNHRAGHYALLLVVASGLFLVNLGAPSLWDIDEGNNAEAAREMLESGNWVVPTFNYDLRPDKPALLYWLQMAGYSLWGVNEFAARLPSALAALAGVLLTYELGRRLFDAGTGLVAGLVLAGTVMFCAAAHFANPDALLNAATVLVFSCCWQIIVRPRWFWFAAAGMAMGLAVLAKGPVGLVLPVGVIVLFRLWNRVSWEGAEGRRTWRRMIRVGVEELRGWLDPRLALAGLVFALTALPWYGLVGAETKGDFLRGFFLIHNVARFLHPMEGHHGPIFYYCLILPLGFAPWSVFLGLTIWNSWKEFRSPGSEAAGARAKPGTDPRLALRFLWCWIVVYFLFFSAAATKLPNYILPVYPPAALLTARFLERWRRGFWTPPAWAVGGSLGCLALMGIGTILGLLLAGESFPFPASSWRWTALEPWALLGTIPLLGACLGAWLVRRGQIGALIAVFAGTAVLFLVPLAGWGSLAIDQYKAPRPLTQSCHTQQTERDIRIGWYQYSQPSLVFYSRRKVESLEDEARVLEFLRYPVPVYLFVPESAWEVLKDKVRGRHHLLGRHHDLYRRCEVVVVTNQ